jgi:hypothetical protein
VEQLKRGFDLKISPWGFCIHAGLRLRGRTDARWPGTQVIFMGEKAIRQSIGAPILPATHGALRVNHHAAPKRQAREGGISSPEVM